MLKIGMMTETIYKYKGMKGSLKLIKDLGFDCADITFQVYCKNYKMISYFANKNYKQRAQKLKEYADKINLPLVQAHSTFPSIKDNNPNYNKAEWKKLLRAIEICGILKIKNLVIHPLHDYSNEINIKFYKKLLPYAKKANVTICAENMWRWDKQNERAKECTSSFANTFNAIIDGVNSKYIKACVDIGHAEMFKYQNFSARKLLEDMGDRVACLHIHDNDLTKDKHWIPFRGKIDFNDVSQGLKSINYNGELIVEICLPNDMNTNKKRLEYWKEVYQSMKKIQRMVG